MTTWTPARIRLLEQSALEFEVASHHLLTVIDGAEDSPQRETLIAANERMSRVGVEIAEVLEHVRSAREFTAAVGEMARQED